MIKGDVFSYVYTDNVGMTVFAPSMKDLVQWQWETLKHSSYPWTWALWLRSLL